MPDVAVKLNRDDLHLLVTWGYSIRGLDGRRFSEPEEHLLDKLKMFRDELMVFGGRE